MEASYMSLGPCWVITVCQILYIWQLRLLYSVIGSDGGTEIYLSDSALIKDPRDKLPLFRGMSWKRGLVGFSSKRLWVRVTDTHLQWCLFFTQVLPFDYILCYLFNTFHRQYFTFILRHIYLAAISNSLMQIYKTLPWILLKYDATCNNV